VQDYIDYRANEMMRKTGRIRAIVVKARQQGCSEYVSGRGYKKTTQRAATTAYILSHEAPSTATLFDKVDRYYNYAPEGTKPRELTGNRYEKKWSNESAYSVGTAGSENTGRSKTIQFLHLSEAAQYKNPEGIKTGLIQCVSDAPGTEIWWESTAFGYNWFKDFVDDAIAGKNEYEVIFIPWFWSDKYSEKAPQTFERTDEEEDLSAQATFFNRDTKQIEPRALTNDQLYWRRRKIEFLKSERLFKQEYPATLQEAFQASGSSFIDPMLVDKCQKSKLEETYGAWILGVDPARSGDRTVLSLRHGRCMEKVWRYENMNEMRLAGIVASIIDEYEVDKCFIDYGLGYGTVDRLIERGYGAIVEGVHFSQAPYDPQYLNKRAEMYFNLRDWMKEGARIPDDPDIAGDLAAIPDFELTSNGKIKFPSKEDIRKNYGGKSPDIADSFILCFAEKVRPKDIAKENHNGYVSNVRGGLSELSTLARIRSGDDSGYTMPTMPVKSASSFKRSGREAYSPGVSNG
jgi:hypothetical protein